MQTRLADFIEDALEKGAIYVVSDSEKIKKNKKSKPILLVENTLQTLQDLAKYHRESLKIPIIAITGSNGKSTTSMLLFEILKRNKKEVRLCGNIGKPILNEKLIKKNTYFIIEISSYQLEYSKFFKYNFAAILNI